MMLEQPLIPFEVLQDEGIPKKLIRNEKGDGMSVDWDKYSSLEETQTRNGEKSEYGVVIFNVGEIRSEQHLFDSINFIYDSLDVEHDPKVYQSHTLIKKIPSKNDPDYSEKLGLLNSIRLFLHDISEWRLIDKDDFLQIADETYKKSKSKTNKNRIIKWIKNLKGD